MPLTIDELDLGIIKSLCNDGRKSFRQISRELGASTPTVQSRYQRLVSIGLIKSIRPVLDLSKINKQGVSSNLSEPLKSLETSRFSKTVPNIRSVSVKCNLCKNSILKEPDVLKIGKIERYFCCPVCKKTYKEKYGNKIKSISKAG